MQTEENIHELNLKNNVVDTICPKCGHEIVFYWNGITKCVQECPNCDNKFMLVP